MKVVDHEPGAWFLFDERNTLFLDVNCNHSAVGYSVMIQLNAQEESEYSQKGRAYLSSLAQAVENSESRQDYRLRDVTAIYSKEAMAAVNEWRKEMDLREREIQAENCSICVEFPDELTVNTGRDYSFPPAFNKLIPVGVEFYSQGQASQFQRCPNCGTYYIWDDFPQMYGSGNNAEERLTRFSEKASRLLNNLFTNGLKAPIETAEVNEYFDTIPLNPLLDELQRQVGKAPEIVTPFVPKLVSLLGKYDSVWVRDLNNLLNAYAALSVKRAAEVETAQAQYAFSIMEKHFAHAGAIMTHNDLPKDWSHFRLLFYLNVIEIVEKGTDEKLLKGLLAELINFIRVCSVEDFNNNLYNLLTYFGPRYSWLEPFLPELARVKISELEEMRVQYEADDERLRLDQLYY